MPSDIEIIDAQPLAPATLAWTLHETAQECRSTLEKRAAELNPQTAIAVDLVADLVEEVALWLEHGPDLDAAPHLAAVLALLHTEAAPRAEPT